MNEHKIFATPWLREDMIMPRAPVSRSISTKILLPFDCSPSSYPALEMATDLAQHLHAELHLLNVITRLAVATGTEFFSETEFFSRDKEPC